MKQQLPEPHRPVEISKDKWVWPDCEAFDINGTLMFCSDVFRATGTTFIRMIDWKHLDDYQARRYVAGEYFTSIEWNEIVK